MKKNQWSQGAGIVHCLLSCCTGSIALNHIHHDFCLNEDTLPILKLYSPFHPKSSRVHFFFMYTDIFAFESSLNSWYPNTRILFFFFKHNSSQVVSSEMHWADASLISFLLSFAIPGWYSGWFNCWSDAAVEQIVAVYHSASKQKAWDHFTKAQRKNISVWCKQAEVSNFLLW